MRKLNLLFFILSSFTVLGQKRGKIIITSSFFQDTLKIFHGNKIVLLDTILTVGSFTHISKVIDFERTYKTGECLIFQVNSCSVGVPISGMKKYEGLFFSYYRDITTTKREAFIFEFHDLRKMKSLIPD